MTENNIQDIIDQVIDNIIQKRKKKGWTHENMALELGLSPAAYHKIESQTTKLSLKRLLEICEVLEVEIAELFGFSTHKIYNQEFRDNSANKLINNIYHDNRELTERYIDRLEKEIEELKRKETRS
ncbi:MAG: transcriptional regulator [Flavobacteriales bacterium]|nr:transcriptional regulator [Flavobacteriales bacterium]|tara:strand:+ start:37 stop:414 length:378 start_codon:yes stop_codon:yes gene_type:complete